MPANGHRWAATLIALALLGSLGCRDHETTPSTSGAEPGTELQATSHSIRDSYAALNRGQLKEAGAIYAPSTHWEEVGSSRAPTRTRQQLLAGWARLRRDFKDFEIVPRRIVELEGAFLIELVMRGGMGATGRSFAVPVAQLAEVQQGRIVRSSVYRDSLSLQAQVMAPQAKSHRPEKPAETQIITGPRRAKNEAVARRFYRAILDGADIAEELAPEVRSFSHVTGGEAKGVAAARAYFSDLLKRSPDTSLEPTRTFSAGDWVVVELTNRYTIRSKKPGIEPRQVAYRALQIFQVKEGRITWAEVYGDRGQLVRSLAERPPRPRGKTAPTKAPAKQ